MKRGRDAECIPGTVRVVVDTVDSYLMLGGHARERRCHPDSDAIWFQQKQPTGAQSGISFFNDGRSRSHLLRHFLEGGRAACLGGCAVNGDFNAGIEIDGIFLRHCFLTLVQLGDSSSFFTNNFSSMSVCGQKSAPLSQSTCILPAISVLQVLEGKERRAKRIS